MKISHKITIFCVILISLSDFSHTQTLQIDLSLTVKKLNSQLNNRRNYNSSPTSLDLNLLPQGILTMNVCIGSPGQCFNLIFDTGSYHLWVPSIYSHTPSMKGFYSFKSTSFIMFPEKINLNYITGNAEGNKVKDYVSLFNGTQVSMSWMLADRVSSWNVLGTDGILGFGRDYNNAPKEFNLDESFSFIHQLKSNKLISYKIFSQVFTDASTVKLYIGDYPDDFKNYDEGYTISSCKVFDYDEPFSRGSVKSQWNCKLSYLIIGDDSVLNFSVNSIKINQRAVIDSGSNYIMAPVTVLEYFIKYFEKKEKCNYEKQSDLNWSVFFCDQDTNIENFDKISLVFNGTSYRIPTENLFTKIDFGQSQKIKWFFTIIVVDNFDFWILGQAFMKNLHVLYDNEEKPKISFRVMKEFTSDVSNFTTDEDFIITDHIFLIFIVVFIAIGIILLAITCMIFKKRRDRERYPRNEENSVNYNLFNRNINNNN